MIGKKLFSYKLEDGTMIEFTNAMSGFGRVYVKRASKACYGAVKRMTFPSFVPLTITFHRAQIDGISTFKWPPIKPKSILNQSPIDPESSPNRRVPKGPWGAPKPNPNSHLYTFLF